MVFSRKRKVDDAAPVRQLKRKYHVGKPPNISSERNIAEEEDDDDSMPVRQPKRKYHAGKPPNISSGRNHAEEDDDDDYLQFLKQCNALEFHLQSPDSSVEAKSGNLNDLDYESFLKHLVEDGTSYTLEVRGKSGKRIVLKYEPREDVRSEGPNVQSDRVRLKRQKQELVASLRNSRNAPRSERAKYLGRPKNASGRKVNDKAEKLRKEATDNTIRVSKDTSDKRFKVLGTRRNAAVQDENHASGRRKDCKRGPPEPPKVNRSEKEQEESEEWDESYLVFMHFMRNDGETVLFNHEAGNVRYEEDEVEESSSSDLVILASEDIEKEGNTPFVITKMKNCINLDNGNLEESEHSEFRKKLLEKLKMPYDAKECIDLLQKVKCRRKKEIVREMRGGREKSYVTDKLCESYLDQYPDLARKITSAEGNLLKTLNLLRGFFFYLNNLPMEGVFRPWKDSSCLKILAPVPPVVKQMPCGDFDASSISLPPLPPIVKQMPLMKAEPF